jgi:hypothetical protein
MVNLIGLRSAYKLSKADLWVSVKGFPARINQGEKRYQL